MKNKSYRLLSILLSILVLVSACICPAVVNADTANVSRGTNVVYIKTTNAGPIGQQVSVTAGETYVYTFSLSNDITPTVAVNDASSRWVSLLSNVTVTEISKDTTTSDKYTTYTYELAFSSSFSKTSAIVGIKLGGTKEGYLFNSYIYKKSDTNKTQMFVNGGFENGYLDSWIYKYMTFSAGKNALSLTNCTFAAENGTVGDTGETYLEVMNVEDTEIYDESFMPATTPDKMVKITSNHTGPFGTQISTTAGETYTFKFGISDGLGFNVVLYDKDARYSNLNATATPKSSDDTADGYTYYEYEVVVPSTYTKDGAILGITLKGTAPYEGYFFDASAYKTSDTSKTELIANGDFAEGYLNNWVWKYTNFGANGNLTEKTFQEDSRNVTVKVVDFDANLMATENTPDPEEPAAKMLHITSNHTGPIGSQIAVTSGETYTFKFGLSNNLDFNVVLHDRDTRQTNLNATATLKNSEDKGGYTYYEYEVVVPSTYTKDGAILGITLKGTAPYEGYFFDASAYKTSDTNKTELFENAAFADGTLNKWVWKYHNFSTKNLTTETFTEDNKQVTVEVIDFDATLMPDNSAKMLHINSQNAGPLGQLITAKPGETYTLKFAISNNAKFDVVTNDGSSRHKAINSTVEYISGEDKGRYAVYEYEVTMPDDLTEKANNILLGIKFKGATPYDCYLMDVSAYKTSDTEKTNLLTNGDFANGYLDNWRFKYTNFAGDKAGLSSSTFTEDSKSITLEVMKFDETKMADVAAELPDPAPKMLHINSQNAGPLGQLITAKAGETYTITFAVSNNAKFDVVTNDGSSRHVGINSTVEFVSGEDKGRYAIWTYNVTMPDNLTEKANNILLGIKFKGATPYDCYLMDVSAYKTSDTEKTNLFTNGDFMSGYLDNWRFKYTNFAGDKAGLSSSTFTEDSKSITLEVVKFDETKMADVAAEIPDTDPKMLHINSQNAGPLGQLITAKPGETYTITFAVSNNAKFDVVTNDGSSRHKAINSTVEYVSGEDKGRYAIWTYNVTMPDDLTEKANNILLGIKFKGATPYDCYLMDVSAYKTSDTEKTNLFTNGDFMGGYLDNWRFKYTNFAGDKAGLSSSTFTEDDKSITLEVMKFDETKMADVAAELPNTEPQMLHINSESAGPLGQQVSVVAGEKYTFTFDISNNLKFDVVVNHKDSRHQKLDADVEFVSGVDHGKYATHTYEITMPETITDKDGKATNNVIVGLFLKGNAPYDGYLTNAVFYKSDDETKTNTLKNGDFFSSYLDGWAFKYTNFTSGANLGLKTSTFTDDSKNVTLEVVKFDESVMADATAKFPNNDPKMLHITSESAGPLGQQVNVVAGEKYTFTFDISNNLKFDVVLHDKDSRHSKKEAEVEFVDAVVNGRYTTYTYEITIPDPLLDKNGDPTSTAIIGLSFKGATPYDGYFANASFYKSDDETKTNALKNGDFFSGYLDSWVWKYENFSSKGYETHTFTDDSKNVTLEVVKFDENVMADVEAELPNTEPQMLHIVSGSYGPIGQLVNVEGGETYTITFAMSNNLMFDIAVHDKDSRHSATAGVEYKYVSAEEKGRYTIYTYEIIMPEKILSTKTGEETNLALVGIKLKGAKPYDGYLTDVYLYKNSDETKKNLFKNGDFFSGYLDSWIFKYKNFTSGANLGLKKSEFVDDINDVTLEVVKFDESVMQDVAASLPDYSQKMIYFKNGALTQPFSAWVDAAPGKKFIVTYSIYATDEVLPHFNANGLRGNVSGNLELLNQVDHGNYQTYTYRMTVPETYEDNLIFLGFRMPFYAEGYLFDIECYEEGDASKKSAWKNGEFVYGFNDWIWGWTVTWFTQAGNQLKEWSDAVQQIKIVPYDLSQIDALIADINRNDGEWWKPTDIIEEAEEELGVATVKGTFTDQNGKPLSDVKLVLISNDYTYETTTDKDGKFIFENVIEGYYELYYVNSQGEQVLTSFAYTLRGGDTATLTIVSDTTELLEAAVSNVDGTVYTAELEVVPDLKIYLRDFGETVTDKDGKFTFSDVPVGEYEIYTILEDGTEYVFRTVSVKSGVDLAVKLKYDPASSTGVDLDGDGKVDVWYSDSYEGDLPDNSTNSSDSESNDDSTDNATGNLKGTVYTPALKTVAGIKVYLRGIAETVTDKDGNFVFTNIPVGEYELYTILEDGSEYVFRTVSIKEGVDLAVKLKYDASTAGSDGALASYWIWIIVGCGVVVLAAAGVILFIILKRKHKKSEK